MTQSISLKSKTSLIAGKYCLAIFSLTQSEGKPPISARLAAYFKVTPATVCLAVKRLKRDGFIYLDGVDKAIKLTECGQDLAVNLLQRQTLMTRFLAEVFGFSKEEAQEEAQHLKHKMSPRIEKALSNYLRTE